MAAGRGSLIEPDDVASAAGVGAGAVGDVLEEDEEYPHAKRHTRQGSAVSGHRRLPSRSDSLGFSFRGHSRQASRTDSIYTIRADPGGGGGGATAVLRDKLFFWKRCKSRKGFAAANGHAAAANGFAAATATGTAAAAGGHGDSATKGETQI